VTTSDILVSVKAVPCLISS